MGSRIFSFFSIFELRKLEKISKNDFKKISGKKIYTQRNTFIHPKISQFIYLFPNLSRGAQKKYKTKNTGSWDGSKQNYGSHLLLFT
jgi:hypothetical protein